MKLNITAFGISCGAISALSIIIYSVLASVTGFGIEIESIVESLHPGYTLSIAGTIIGAIWEFVYGYLWGVILAWFYNVLSVSKK